MRDRDASRRAPLVAQTGPGHLQQTRDRAPGRRPPLRSSPARWRWPRL